MDNNIWLKSIALDDGIDYCNLLIELANYENAYARPVPSDFTQDDFASFKVARVNMAKGENLKEHIMPISTYWVMEDNIPIGYATLKHKIDINKPGGHFGLCLKKEYQNRGIGTIVSDELSKIAYYDLGIEEVIYTAKNENLQSRKSLEKIGAQLIDVHDGYHFYKVDLKEKIQNNERRKK